MRSVLLIRELARHRLELAAAINTEDWARQVEEARKRGRRLVWLPGLTVSIRDYSLLPAPAGP